MSREDETRYPLERVRSEFEFLPCPFCGSDAVSGSQSGALWCHVACDSCGASTKSYMLPSRTPRGLGGKPFEEIWIYLTKKAAKDWNRRKKPKK